MIVGIGNDKSTSLWYHHWVGEGPLYSLKDVKIRESKVHLFVSNIIRNGAWYLKEVDHLIPNHIKTLILLYPLSNNLDEEYFIRWNYSKSGNFNMKSAYHLQFQNVLSQTSNQVPWKSIWKIKVSYKYKMLLWNCYHEILHVAHNLNRFINDISPYFSRCNSYFESHIHPFRDCAQSSILWAFIFQRIWKN